MDHTMLLMMFFGIALLLLVSIVIFFTISSSNKNRDVDVNEDNVDNAYNANTYNDDVVRQDVYIHVVEEPVHSGEYTCSALCEECRSRGYENCDETCAQCMCKGLNFIGSSCRDVSKENCGGSYRIKNGKFNKCEWDGTRCKKGDKCKN